MKEIESILEPITGNLNCIKRNSMEGWYEMEIGIPNNWVFNENDEIGVEIISETEMGKLIKIIPKNRNIVVDDLVLFAKIVINTNQKIAEREVEFKSQLEEMKKGIEKKASEFFKELDELKENSFKKLNDNFVAGLNGEKRQRKKRTRKVHTPSGDTQTHIPPTILKIDDFPK